MTWKHPPTVLDAHGRHAMCVGFTHDDRLLVSVGLDKTVRLWSVPGFEPVAAFEGHANSVNTISLSQDERMLATASSDGTVRVWTFPEGECVQILEKQVNATFSPSGNTLATIARNGRLHVWDASTWETVLVVPTLDKRSFNVAFAPDQRALLVGGTGPIHRVGLPNGELQGRMEGHDLAVASLLVSPAGDLLASAGGDGSLRFWSTHD